MKLNSLSSLNLTECDERWQRRLVRPLPPLAGAVLGINQHSSSQPIMLPLDSRYCRYYYVLVLTTSAATHRYISTFLFLPWTVHQGRPHGILAMFRKARVVSTVNTITTIKMPDCQAPVFLLNCSTPILADAGTLYINIDDNIPARAGMWRHAVFSGTFIV